MVEVIFYTGNGCSFCQLQKEWFEKQGISYLEKNLEDREIYKEFLNFKVKGIPYTIIKTSEKEHRVVGFNKTELQHVFEKIR